MRYRHILIPLVATVLVAAGCGAESDPTAQVADRPQCPHQQAVVAGALHRSHLQVDVSGDGKPDTVAAASDPGAAKPCRGFVAVRTFGGGVHAAHLIPNAVPIRSIRARIIGVPRLGDRAGADIVVDTGAAADAVLAQLFTFTGGRLRAVHVPGQPNGSFIVVGGGVVFPRGAGCTRDGRLIVSHAAQTADHHSFRVTRRTYPLRPDGLGFTQPDVTRATVPMNQLGVRFPEFVGPHWRACSGGPT
jgi:hypothetical protein